MVSTERIAYNTAALAAGADVNARDSDYAASTPLDERFRLRR